MRWVFAVGVLAWPAIALGEPPVVLPTRVEVGEGGTVALAVRASDPDGDALSFSWDLDGDGSFDDSTEEAPEWSAAGFDGPRLGLRVEVLVSDGPSSTEGWVEVDILNVPPIFEDEGGVRLIAGRAWTHVVPVTDPGGDAVTLEASGPLPQHAELDETNSVITWTPEPSQVGEHEILLRAEDDDGAATLHEIAITVVQNRPPPTPAIAAVIEDGVAIVTLSRVDDPDGDEVQVHVEIDHDVCFCSWEVQGSAGLAQGAGSTTWQTPRALDVVAHQRFFLRRWASDGLDDSERDLALVDAPPGPEPDAGWYVECTEPPRGCCYSRAEPCRVAGRHESAAPLAPLSVLVVLLIARARRRRAR